MIVANWVSTFSTFSRAAGVVLELLSMIDVIRCLLKDFCQYVFLVKTLF